MQSVTLLEEGIMAWVKPVHSTESVTRRITTLSKTYNVTTGLYHWFSLPGNETNISCSSYFPTIGVTLYSVICKKIIEYNFVTLISANIFQLHFHLRHTSIFTGPSITAFQPILAIQNIFPSQSIPHKAKLQHISLSASRINNSQIQSFSIYKVTFLKSRHNSHKNNVKISSI